MVVLGKIELSSVKLRLDNINKKATKFVSFEPIETTVIPREYLMDGPMSCLENENACYPLDPSDLSLIKDREVFAYDESTQDFKSLEGDLIFCSSALIKIGAKYEFNLTVLPYFLTSMRKFKGANEDEIRYTDEPSAERNKIIVEAKQHSILEGTENHSIVFIDGPLIGGMVSFYMREMDQKLREKDCIPIYFVKNSDSRLVITNSRNPELSVKFNSDFHWATHRLKERSRSAFFKYTDEHNPKNTKVFCYIRTLAGFPERIEMHPSTYETYGRLIPSIMNLISYFYIVQGDYANPQVRPIVIAEKYAREGLRMLNIPVLLARQGFHPTINQVRFG
jgi:hypothetical protein